VEYVSGIVIDGLADAIVASLNYLHAQVGCWVFTTWP